MDFKDKLLSNPHITIDDKRAKRLGISRQDLERHSGVETQEATSTGPAQVLPDLTPQTRKEVVVRKKRGKRGDATKTN